MSDVRADLVKMLQFLRDELEDAIAEGDSGVLVMIARGHDETQFVVSQSKRGDAQEILGMSGARADNMFTQADRNGLIDVSWGQSGRNSQTPTPFVTGVTLQGLELLGEWESPQQQPSQSFVFNQSTVSGMFGSQQHFRVEQFTQTLEGDIEEHGWEDKEELREMMAEIQRVLENQDSISRSKFERWSELANKHAGWLLGPLGTLLINYAFGVPGSGD